MKVEKKLILICINTVFSHFLKTEKKKATKLPAFSTSLPISA